MVLVQIDTGYACAGVMSEDGVITETAPIFKWMVGKTVQEVKKWPKIKSIKVVRRG